jgi:acetoacetate decarboxylase
MSEKYEREYPPEPWRLQGDCFGAFRFVDLDSARPFVPAGLSLVPVLPGKTLAGLVLIDYGPGSTLNYHELLVFPGLVRFKTRPGIFVSHIYVDNLLSLKGGREMFGVPKELVFFKWKVVKRSHLEVKQDGRLLLAFDSVKSVGFNLRIPFLGAAFGDAAGDLRRFKWKSTFQGWLSSTRVEISADSPFTALELDSPHFSVEMRAIDSWIGKVEILNSPYSEARLPRSRRAGPCDK